jgi:hypothetical protein
METSHLWKVFPYMGVFPEVFPCVGRPPMYGEPANIWKTPRGACFSKRSPAHLSSLQHAAASEAAGRCRLARCRPSGGFGPRLLQNPCGGNGVATFAITPVLALVIGLLQETVSPRGWWRNLGFRSPKWPGTCGHLITYLTNILPRLLGSGRPPGQSRATTGVLAGGLRLRALASRGVEQSPQTFA